MSLSRFEESLLASGVSDGPPPERRRAAREAVLRAAGVAGLAGASTLATASTASAATAASGATAATTASVTSFAKIVTLAKIVFLAAIGMGATIVAVTVFSPDRESAPPATSAPSMMANEGPRTMSPASDPTDSPPVVAASALPAAPAPPQAEVRPARVLVPPSVTNGGEPEPDPLVVEARILEAARKCLAADDRTCARTRLAEHERRFPKGALADEATVLAIDVALADGDRSEARRLARALVARRPHGPWSARVRTLTEENE